MISPFSAMLFDLDGTLVDTAPDLAFALNSLLQQQGFDPLPYDLIRPVASHGSPGLLSLGFGINSEHPDYPSLQQQFLTLYQENIIRETRLFEGMEKVLSSLEAANIPWGVITNKPAFLTEPLLNKLNLSQRAACIVSADTTPHSKPHPAPMLHACKVIDHEPTDCIYIGDAQRDIDAGKNVKMQTVTARYGYLTEDDQAESWLADAMIDHPTELLQWI